jgi:hypothetical protein
MTENKSENVNKVKFPINWTRYRENRKISLEKA